jgi:hypothetical protein
VAVRGNPENIFSLYCLHLLSGSPCKHHPAFNSALPRSNDKRLAEAMQKKGRLSGLFFNQRMLTFS